MFEPRLFLLGLAGILFCAALVSVPVLMLNLLLRSRWRVPVVSLEHPCHGFPSTAGVTDPRVLELLDRSGDKGEPAHLVFAVRGRADRYYNVQSGDYVIARRYSAGAYPDLSGKFVIVRTRSRGGKRCRYVMGNGGELWQRPVAVVVRIISRD